MPISRETPRIRTASGTIREPHPTRAIEDEKIRDCGLREVLGDTDGAEGQNRTAYAGLFRAALYR